MHPVLFFWFFPVMLMRFYSGLMKRFAVVLWKKVTFEDLIYTAGAGTAGGDGWWH